MAALRDRTFNKGAWARLGLVGLGLIAVVIVIYISVGVHRHYVEVPRLLAQRYVDPLGHPGRATTQIANLGGKAVDTLLADLAPGKNAQNRSKSLEILSAIDDPRVVPALVAALKDPDLGLRLAGLAGLARTQRSDLTKHLWPHTSAKNGFFRHRAIVALGLVSGADEVPKLLKAAKETSGRDQLLLVWAAGYALRRAKLKDRGSARVRPMDLKDAAHERAVQQEVNELRAKLQRDGIDEAGAERLAELVTVDFGTWNLNHQISYQTIMVSGPMALRGLARIPAPKKVDPKAKTAKKKGDAPAAMPGLKLKNRPKLDKPASK